MAKIVGTRLGLITYTDPQDTRPGRLEYNAERVLLEQNVVVGGQGTNGARPTAGRGKAAYWNTDRNVLQWDDGTGWQDVSAVGGGGTPQNIRTTGTGTEGSSARGARADHTHLLPLATVSAHGAMAAGDKARLDSATNTSAPNTLMLRDGSGRAQAVSPAAAADIATKGYVDATIGGAAAPVVSAQDNGLATPGILAAAQSVVEATSAATPGALARRDSAGRTQVATPSATLDAANKTYVDSQLSAQRHDATHITTGTLNPARLPLATTTSHGALPAADKAKLDGSTTSNTGGTLVSRTSSGTAEFGVPLNPSDAATKAYVDNGLSGKAAQAHAHTAADVTSGVFSTARLPQASASTPGMLSTQMYGLLANATNTPTRDTLAVRDSSGRAQFADPATGADAATKNYVDSNAASTYHNHSADQITSGTLNPARLPLATRDTQGGISADLFRMLDDRTAEATPWTIARRSGAGTIQVETGTNGKDAANKAYVDDQKQYSSRYAEEGLVMRWADGRGGEVNNPKNGKDIANKQYVDNHTWDGSDITSGTIPYGRIAGSNSAYNNIQTGTNWTLSVNSSGFFARFSSTRRHKTNIREWAKDPRALLAVVPSVYDRIDPHTGRIVRTQEVGVVAEQGEEAGVPEFVQYGPDAIDDNGDPTTPPRVQGWDYAQWTAAQQLLHRWEAERVDDLISRVKRLEAMTNGAQGHA